MASCPDSVQVGLAAAAPELVWCAETIEPCQSRDYFGSTLLDIPPFF